MKLSILILTTEGREEMLGKLLAILEKQKTDQIEILVESDKGETKLGKKRNNLLDRARGDYIVFIDDDDMIPDYYVEEILKGLQGFPDCCSLEGVMTTDGKNPKIFKHSIKYDHWFQDGTFFYRCPNHWNVVRRDIACYVRFKDDMSWSEDHDYSLRLRPYLKTEYGIEKIMYYFQYRNIPKGYHKHR